MFDSDDVTWTRPVAPMFPAPRWALPRRRWGSLLVGWLATLCGGVALGALITLAATS